MISVFVVMPGLLMLFGPYMDKTKHKNFVPDIPFVGRFAWRTRKIVPAIFVVVILIAYHFSSLCPYAYGCHQGAQDERIPHRGPDDRGEFYEVQPRGPRLP